MIIVIVLLLALMMSLLGMVLSIVSELFWLAILFGIIMTISMAIMLEKLR